MKQYGLRTPTNRWLPRDAYKRGTLRVRMETPDLWQDKERAISLAGQYGCELVEFNVSTYLDRDGNTQPGHGKGE